MSIHENSVIAAETNLRIAATFYHPRLLPRFTFRPKYTLQEKYSKHQWKQLPSRNTETME